MRTTTTTTTAARGSRARTLYSSTAVPYILLLLYGMDDMLQLRPMYKYMIVYLVCIRTYNSIGNGISGALLALASMLSVRDMLIRLPRTLPLRAVLRVIMRRTEPVYT